jgi:hypothetical protein
MTLPDDSYAFNASNYPGFQEALSKDSAAKERTFSDDYEAPLTFVAMLALGAVLVMFLSDFEFRSKVLIVAALTASIVIVIALSVHFYRKPRIGPIRITTGGELVHGNRRWRLDSMAEIELSGHVLIFRGKDGRKLGEADDCEAGDLESLVAALKRLAPDVVFRADLTSVPPRQIRIPKM